MLRRRRARVGVPKRTPTVDACRRAAEAMRDACTRILTPTGDFVGGHMRHYRHRWAEAEKEQEEEQELEERQEQRCHVILLVFDSTRY